MVLFWLMTLLVLLPGCTFVSDIPVNSLSLPERYLRQSLIVGEKENHVDLTQWWSVFDSALLRSFINQALEANYDVLIALEKIEEARHNYRIARSQLFPSINGLAAIFKSSLGETIFNPFPLNKITSAIAALETFWELDVWGKIRKNKNNAAFLYEAQIEDMRDVRVMLLAQVATTYIHLCALQKKIIILSASQEADKKLVFLAQDSFSSGIENKPNFLVQAISYHQTATQLIDAQADLQATHHALAFLLGKMPHQLLLSNDEIGRIPQIISSIEIESPYALLCRRPDIRRAERLLCASHEVIGAAMAEWLPKISLLAIAGKTAISGKIVPDTDSKLLSVGPLLAVPAIDFGRIYSNVQMQSSKERQAQLSYEKTVLNAVKEVEDALVQCVQEQKKYFMINEKCDHEEDRLALINDAFVSGIEAEVSVLIQQKQLYNIQLDLVDSEETYAKNIITLYKALGGGW